MSFDFPTFLALYDQYQRDNLIEPSPRRGQGDRQVLTRSQMQQMFRSVKIKNLNELKQVCNSLRKLDLYYLEGKLFSFEHPDEQTQRTIKEYLRESVETVLRERVTTTPH